MRIATILNPAAGREEPVLSTLNRVFREAEVEWEALVTHAEEDASRLALRARDDGADVVAAYGGDGTVAAVGAALAGGDVPLAIFPGGTGNSLAQDLEIPLELEAAARLAVNEKAPRRGLDALRTEHGLALLRWGLGADARMVEAASRGEKDAKGWFAYLLGALEQVRDPERIEFRLELDGEAYEIEALTCLVLNAGRIGRGGASFGAEVSPFDRTLDVLLVREPSLATITELGGRMLGLLEDVVSDAPDAPIVRLRGESLAIRSNTPFAAQADGEWAGELDALDVRVEPAAVPVVCPLPVD